MWVNKNVWRWQLMYISKSLCKYKKSFTKRKTGWWWWQGKKEENSMIWHTYCVYIHMNVQRKSQKNLFFVPFVLIFYRVCHNKFLCHVSIKCSSVNGLNKSNRFSFSSFIFPLVFSSVGSILPSAKILFLIAKSIRRAL